jgi:hypothetical protein
MRRIEDQSDEAVELSRTKIIMLHVARAREGRCGGGGGAVAQAFVRRWTSTQNYVLSYG